MPDRANVAYCYDGSFEGLLCCIFESFEKKERPVSIQPEGMGQLTLYPPRAVQTELSKARRVEAGLRRKPPMNPTDWWSSVITPATSKRSFYCLILRALRCAMEEERSPCSRMIR